MTCAYCHGQCREPRTVQGIHFCCTDHYRLWLSNQRAAS